MTDKAMPGNSRNRHPVDQLADVRAEIKRLTAVEDDLKAKITKEMGTRDSLGGDQFIASQALQERKGGLDEARIAAALRLDNLDAYRKPKSTFVVLKVEPRVMAVA